MSKVPLHMLTDYQSQLPKSDVNFYVSFLYLNIYSFSINEKEL